MTLMVPHIVHLQDVVKLHTFVLGHLGALLLECFGFDLRFALVISDLVSDSIWCAWRKSTRETIADPPILSSSAKTGTAL